MGITLTQRQVSDVSIAMNIILMFHRMISTGNFEGHDSKDVFHGFNQNAQIVNNLLQLPSIQLYEDIDGNEY